MGIGGIFIVGASMIGSIGVISYFGIGMTMISLEVYLYM